MEEAPKLSIFPDTPWSLVLNAQGGEETHIQRALGEICQIYWYPLYTCARRAGLAPGNAEDCVQGLFTNLLANRSFESVAEDRGRLRAFLQVAMKNFVAQEWRKSQSQKRGGGSIHLSIDQEWGEQQFKNEPASSEDLGADFDRSWAYSLLHNVFKRLEDYYEEKGKSEHFHAVKGCLKGDGKYDAAIAEELKLSNEGLRSLVFKLRRRFREYIEEEVKETCAHEDDAREEIRYLCQILAT